MEKILVHDDDNEDIHYIKGSFLGANKTLCGQHLNSISTTHVKKLDVTCKKCLKIVEKTKKKHIKKLDGTFRALWQYDPAKQTFHNLTEMHDKINELVKIVNQLLENK